MYLEMSLLQAFVAVAECESFSLAAERLHLTQPAVSKRISQLEQRIEQRLFDRINRRIHLTEAGRLLLPHAQNMRNELEQFAAQLQGLDSQQPQGKLSVATSHHIGLHRLPPVLRAFMQQYPKVDLDLHFMDSEQACRAIENHELDIAIVTLPSRPSSMLQTRLLWPDPMQICVATDHELAQSENLNIETLLQYPAILPAHGTYTREIIEDHLGERVGQLQLALETNYLETIKMMVSVGLGWSVLPLTMHNPQMRSFTLPGLEMYRELGLVLHQHKTQGTNARALIRCLAEVTGEILPLG